MEELMFDDDEKKKFIEMMLNNDELENKVRMYSKKKSDENRLFDLLKMLAQRNAENGGLIIAAIKMGEDDRLQCFDAQNSKPIKISYITNHKNQKYAMVFTSKEKFDKYKDLTGHVMFVDQAVSLIENNLAISGMIINMETDNVILDKVALRILKMMILGK